MPGIAFLHTSDAHIPTFAGLMEKLAPELGVHHLVDAPLLADTMAVGEVTEEILRRMEGRLSEASATGAGLIVCTCSTLGGAAEELGQASGLPVLRIDRAMAERAVDLGSPILVAACVASTVGPTGALLAQVADERGKTPVIETVVLEGAWERFEAGDLEGYYNTIAEGLRAAVDGTGGGPAVVVLAQASMAPAAERCRDIDVPVLSSPEMGVRCAIDLLAAG